MSEESPENFNNGDVVWVKLGSSWWPGEVKDAKELPNDFLDFKKPPLVIVKFFDEDSYEYIKSWANIYPYNCERKNDFIKKGMAAYRAKVSHMDKFPKDVLTAESKVGGNPNILSEPIFLPDKKKNYAAEIFGTPSPKVNKEKRRSNTKSSQKNKAHITHRRFLGVDDYRAYICIQYPGKDRIPGDTEDEEVQRINREPEQEFNCQTCSFTTKRLDVMVLHAKSYIQGVYVSSPRKNKQPAVRKKKEKTKKSRAADDVIESESSSSDSEPVRERKRKSKSQSVKEPKLKKTDKKEAVNQSIDIRNELLAVWDDSNDEDDEFNVSLDKLGKPIQKLSQSTLEGVLSGTIIESADETLNQTLDDSLKKSEALGDMVEETLEQIRAEVINPSDVEVLNKSQARDELVKESPNESVVEMLNNSGAPKETIQEVLDQSPGELLSQLVSPSKKAPKESAEDVADQPIDVEKFTEDSSAEEELSKDTSKPENANDIKDTGKDEKKMNRDIQEAIKSCFDFDEDEEDDNAIVSKATVGGRKIPRVIPVAERKKSKEFIEDDINRGKILKDSESFNKRDEGEGHSEEVDAAFKELMEMTVVPELPEVQNTLKCEQNFHNIKTIKFPDKPEQVESPPKMGKMEKKDSCEVATKLTNPKKRFVKSFEDFELMQNELRRKEEEELQKIDGGYSNIDPTEEKSHEASCSVVFSNFDDFDNRPGSPEGRIELSKLKSKIMSKIIEEANINEESRSKIMSKIQEPKRSKIESDVDIMNPSYSVSKKVEKIYSSASRRTPRGKILESYRKDPSKEKVEEQNEKQFEASQSRIDTKNKKAGAVEVTANEPVTKKEVVPPKKNKWSRRGSHPKKDRNIFLLENIRSEDPSVKNKYEKDKVSMRLGTKVEGSDILNKLPTNKSDSALECTSFPTNNEMTLMKESSIKETVEETKEEEKNEEILPVPEKSDEFLLIKDAVVSEYKENNKTSVNEETCKVKERDEEFPSKIYKIDDVSSKGVETEKLLSNVDEINKEVLEETKIESSLDKVENFIAKDPDVEISSKNVENEKLSNDVEDEKLSTDVEDEKLLIDIEDEKLCSNIEEINKEFLENYDVEKPSTKDKIVENFSLDDEGITTKLSEVDLETKELCENVDENDTKERIEDKEIKKLSSKHEETKDNETDEAILKYETEQLPLNNEDTNLQYETNEQVVLKDEETPTISSECEEIVELPSKEEEVGKLPVNDEISEKLSTENKTDSLVWDNVETDESCTSEKRSDFFFNEADNFTTEHEINHLASRKGEGCNLLGTEKDESIVKEAEIEEIVKEAEVEEIVKEAEVEEIVKEAEVEEIVKEAEVEEIVKEAVEVKEIVKVDSPKECNSDEIECVSVGSGIPSLNKMINDNCAIPSYQPTIATGNDALNSEIIVQEETILPEEIAVSPSRDAIVLIEDTSVVSPIESSGSPPKKSKKRKLSESITVSVPKTNAMDLVENFSPSEKRIKETDFIDKEKPVPVKSDDQLRDLISTQDGIQEIKKLETVDNVSTINEANTDIVQERYEEVICDVTEPAVGLPDHSKEVEIQCASSSIESFKFSIQTNLSNLTSREEISALALATLSEIKTDLGNDSVIPEVGTEQSVLPISVEPELVPIEGNLTVVSEKDLADGQVEITTEKVISPKRPVTLSNFSMDFSDSGSDSNSNSTNDTLSDTGKCTDFTSKGTEFTSKAMTKQIKKLSRKKENAYERLELLNILEGNSDSEKKPKEYKQPPKKNVMEDICDFEEHIPSQIVCAKGVKRGLIDTEGDFAIKEKSQKMSEKSTASKLLERLTEVKSKAAPAKTSIHNISENIGKFPTKTPIILSTPKQTKLVKSKAPVITSKPIILSEQIIKPASETAKSKPKRMLNDIEDVEAFVIHKDPKKNKPEEEIEVVQIKSAVSKSAGKAKILQQTIITPAGEIIQPTVNQAQTDDNIFDINSMPIVLSDEILTPESIENMPIVIGTDTKSTDQEKPIRKPTQSRIITKMKPQPNINKTHTVTKHSKPPRILQTVGSKVKNSPLLPSTAKPGKYIIVPQSGVPSTKFISKKSPIVKRSPVPTGILTKVPNIAPEPSGNKIMIVTNQQGQQQRLLLTPAQQKMLGYQNQKVTKTVMKGNVLQKSVLATKSVPLVEAGTSGVMPKSPSIIGQKVMVGTNSSPGLITTSSHQIITSQGRNVKNVTKRLQLTNQKGFSTPTKQKTILIKNQHGQTVRKIQGTDDELLDKQVAEQLEAIKASSGMKFSSQPKQMETYKITPKSTVRRSYSKKIEMKPKLGPPPPLSGIQPSPKPEKAATFSTTKKPESVEVKPTPTTVPEETKPERPLNQLVIQDALGNQTTITEGQILALPSETVDGQPQSYMLVTLDETGNLTPLNSEALMSLDPNLGLGGDLSNMVLQIDQGSLTERPQTVAVKASGLNEIAKTVVVESATALPAVPVVPEPSTTTEIVESPQKVEPVVEIPPSTNGDPGQQLIVTGDPIATQKFLESLTEGTTDLANILANADGNSILIQADGQQILINTNSDNQMLLSMNNDSINVSESTEGGGNPIFATQPNKNQDILAAALADTDVFQQEQHSTQGKISQLSPNNALYPMNVGNVLETSLTLNSPIMTPLEVPSTNSKKIPDDEADILTQVPKNVDLPITITDPNISQTVANQQVASLIANELQTNLELTLPISETTISAVSSEMNSPSYVYSLPTLDDTVDMSQKPFNSSMPLLNEDVEDNATHKAKTDEDQKLIDESSQKPEANKPQGVNSDGCFLEEEEGRFTLGGEMCSSLSEPPPEMFDLPEVNSSFIEKHSTNIPSSLQSTPDISDNASKEDDTTDLSTQADTSSEGSCEIPLQPQIITKSLDLSQNLDSLKRSFEESKEGSKKCKFD